MSSSSTVMDLSGGIFYSSFEEVMSLTLLISQQYVFVSVHRGKSATAPIYGVVGKTFPTQMGSFRRIKDFFNTSCCTKKLSTRPCRLPSSKV